jgi:hypothetical protein
MSRRGRVGGALAAGLSILGLALIVTLSGSPLVVTHANATPANEPLLEASSGSGACQSGEVLPAEVSAIRLTLIAAAGPRVSVTVFSGGRVLTSGATGSGWTSGAVTVPVKPQPRAIPAVRICFKLGQSVETAQLGGSRTSAATAATSLAGQPLSGRFTIEYMSAGHSSWWSLAKSAARHMGLGRAPAGSWVALLVLLAMVAAMTSASLLLLRELG